MPQFELLLSTSSLLIFLAAMAAVGLAFLAYRHTIPPIPRLKKFLLTGLRALAVFLLLLLLLEPIVRLVRHDQKPPTVAVLVDNSKSMSLTDKRGSRAETVRNLLKSKNLERLSDIARPLALRFSTGVEILPSSDSLKFDGGATDISAALKGVREKVEDENIQAVLLFSDGNYNLGENPIHEAKRLGLPIYTVGVGDSAEQKDLLITKVTTNEIVYSESRVPMDVTVKSSGYGGERAEVSLSESGKPIAQQFLTVKEGTREYPLSFVVEPKGEGTIQYTVRVSTLEGELTTANNVKSVFVKVLKSKMNVILIAGKPSPDVAFIRRVLEEDKNVNVTALVQKDASDFYERDFSPSLLREADCILLVGYPVSNSRDDVLLAIHAEVDRGGKPLFLLLSREMDIRRLNPLDAELPFSTAAVKADEMTTSLHIPEVQRNHPVLKLAGSPSLWDALPPIYKTSSTFQQKPEAEVLGTARIRDVLLGEPLILARNVTGKKSIAVLGYGLWRWKLLPQAVDESSDVLRAFISNSVRWLTTREELKPVRILPTKEVFSGGEAVEFVAQVYDQSYQPVDGAEVKVTAEKQKESFETLLTSLGNGRYEGKIEGLGEGVYRFSGTAALSGERLGEDHGKFSVGAEEVEYQETRMNKPLLEQIAYQSGGKYFDPKTLSQLVEELPRNTKLTAKQITRAKEYELWSISTMLGLVVALFGVEWFLRKQSGML
jgi:hypothetical protein